MLSDVNNCAFEKDNLGLSTGLIMGIALMQFLNATRKMTVVIIAMKETAQSVSVLPGFQTA